MENIKLIHGECIREMKSIPDGVIDLIVCDLPYGQKNRNKWDVVIPFDELWEQYNRIIKSNGAIVLFSNGMFTADLMQSNSKMWKYNLIWEKAQPSGHLNAKRMPLRSHEDICVFYKNQPTYNPQKTVGHERKVSKVEHRIHCKQSTDYGVYNPVSYDSTERYPRSVWKYAKDTQKSSLHPTQKPLALLEQLIRTYSNPGDTVLDNCMGSGSTGVVCIRTRRNFIGIEIGDEYFEFAKERIRAELERKENGT